MWPGAAGGFPGFGPSRRTVPSSFARRYIATRYSQQFQPASQARPPHSPRSLSFYVLSLSLCLPCCMCAPFCFCLCGCQCPTARRTVCTQKRSQLEERKRWSWGTPTYYTSPTIRATPLTGLLLLYPASYISARSPSATTRNLLSRFQTISLPDTSILGWIDSIYRN